MKKLFVLYKYEFLFNPIYLFLKLWRLFEFKVSNIYIVNPIYLF